VTFGFIFIFLKKGKPINKKERDRHVSLSLAAPAWPFSSLNQAR